MKECSFITVAHNRNKNLGNQLKGILESTKVPDDIIIVDIGNTVRLPQRAPNGILRVELEPNGLPISLAAARNAGALAARSNNLIFLDADCIPSPTFIEKILSALREKDGLVMGSPRYLAEPVSADYNEDDLVKASQPHPDMREVNKPLIKTTTYSLFRSLCFGISKRNFEEIGGFDMEFHGYGAEDTDFAFMARKKGVDLYLSDAVAFHQPHTAYTPPVNHLDSIIQNSNHFKQKWGEWPMQNWLSDFDRLGLISWAANKNEPITKVRDADNDLMHKCRRENVAYK